MRTEPLVYEPMGRSMQTEPSNTSIENVRTSLAVGSSTMVVLKPGDGTMYHLMLVPCKGLDDIALEAFGIPTDKANQYCYVSKLSVDDCRGTWVCITDTIIQHDVESLSDNEWSVEFIAWWLNELLAAWRSE